MRWRFAATIALAVVLAFVVGGVAVSGSRRECRGSLLRCTKRGIYIAQTTRGNGAGTRCGNAHGVAWFNDPANWAPSSGRIRPGAVVRLCGTISTALVMRGSGRSGRPITIYWQRKARLSSPDWNGGPAIDTRQQHFLTLDGGVNGVIQATGQGTALRYQGISSQGIYALGCTGCTIENLTIENLYRHTSAADTSVDQTLDDGIVFSGSYLKIADNRIHDVGWGLFSRWATADGHDRIYGNDIYHIDHGFAASATGTIGPMFFYRNHIHDMANWDARSSDGGLPYHHDGLHCYGPVGGPAPTYHGFYIYDNRFDGTVGRDAPTGMIFMEGGSGSGATPCASAASTVDIFNNVITSSDYVTTNQYMGTAAIAGGVYNNTVSGHSKYVDLGGCAGYGYEQPGAAIAFENNLLSNCDNLMTQTGNPRAGALNGVFTPGNPDYNVYASGGSNAFICDGHFYAFRRFGAWKRCIRADRHSRRVADARLEASGAPRAGSAAIGAGANLTYLCHGPMVALCRNIAGRRRPRRGPWNAGAY